MASLSQERTDLREQMRFDENRIHLLNQKLLASNQPGDYRPMNEYPPEEESTATPLSGADIRSFVKASLENNSNNEVTGVDLENVLSALGLDKQGHMTNEAKKDRFAKGIRTLCNAHFGNYAEKEQAHILGELLFNSRVFAKEHSDDVSAKTTASVASCVFNSVALLKCIDSKAGSLNDSASHEYYMIERDSDITESRKGKSILRPRHHLTGARKVANGLVDHLFAFVDEQGKPMLTEEESNDMILFEPARLFRFMVEVFDLKEKALRWGSIICYHWRCSGCLHGW